MKLSEALDPIYGVPEPPETDPRMIWETFAATAHGFGLAIGRPIVASTNAKTMRLHDLDRNTRSPAVDRATCGPDEADALLAAIDEWEPESGRWGADPFDLDEPIQREESRCT